MGSSKKHKKHKSERRKKYEEYSNNMDPSQLSGGLKLTNNSPFGPPTAVEAMMSSAPSSPMLQEEETEYRERHKKSKKKKKKKDREKKHKHHKEKRHRNEHEHSDRHIDAASSAEPPQEVEELTADVPILSASSMQHRSPKSVAPPSVTAVDGDSSQDEFNFMDDDNSQPLPENILFYAGITTDNSPSCRPVSKPIVARKCEELLLGSPASSSLQSSSLGVGGGSPTKPLSDLLIPSPSASTTASTPGGASSLAALTPQPLEAPKTPGSSSKSGREPRTYVLKLKQQKSPRNKLLDHLKSKKKKKKKDREKKHKYHKEKRHRNERHEHSDRHRDAASSAEPLQEMEELTADVPILSASSMQHRSPKSVAPPSVTAVDGDSSQDEFNLMDDDNSQPLPENILFYAGITKDNSLNELLDHLLRLLEKRDPHQFFAWPVTDDIAPGYSSIISKPMDDTIYDMQVQHYEQHEIEEIEREYENYKNTRIDFARLRTLSDIGIDVSFLDDMETEMKNFELMQEHLSNNLNLIDKLRSTLHDRLSQPLPQHLTHVPQPSAEETYLAHLITQQLSDLAKSLRKAMGLSYVGLPPPPHPVDGEPVPEILQEPVAMPQLHLPPTVLTASASGANITIPDDHASASVMPMDIDEDVVGSSSGDDLENELREFLESGSGLHGATSGDENNIVAQLLMN